MVAKIAGLCWDVTGGNKEPGSEMNSNACTTQGSSKSAVHEVQNMVCVAQCLMLDAWGQTYRSNQVFCGLRTRPEAASRDFLSSAQTSHHFLPLLLHTHQPYIVHPLTY